MGSTDHLSAAASVARLQTRILDACEAARDRVVDRAIALASVPSPTGQESQRSALTSRLFASVPNVSVTTDEIGDVVGRMRGAQRGMAVLLAGHIDTVFPAATPLAIRRENGRVHGPGIGDNALGTSAVMAIPEILAEAGVVPAIDLLLTGNVGEEGLGNLRGMRRVMDDHPDIRAAIAVEGHNLGRVTHVAVGSRRLRVRVVGPGGHSWGDFGNPNAIHAAAEIIHELSRIALPSNPKTTLSVGTISGGISINTIAPEASFDVDLRSIEEFALQRLVERVQRVFAVQRPGVRIEVEVLGDRPAGFISPDRPIVRHATQILERLGIAPAGDASSTDANIPISRNIPAVCVGLTSGGHVHREDEYIDTAPLARGLAQLALLTIAVAEDAAHGRLA